MSGKTREQQLDELLDKQAIYELISTAQAAPVSPTATAMPMALAICARLTGTDWSQWVLRMPSANKLMAWIICAVPRGWVCRNWSGENHGDRMVTRIPPMGF